MSSLPAQKHHVFTQPGSEADIRPSKVMELQDPQEMIDQTGAGEGKLLCPPSGVEKIVALDSSQTHQAESA
jgi:hypothetical protein